MIDFLLNSILKVAEPFTYSGGNLGTIVDREKPMPGLDNYDQWKTASPYDDDDDVIQNAETIVRHARNSGITNVNPGGFGSDLSQAIAIIEGLLEYIEDNI